VIDAGRLVAEDDAFVLTTGEQAVDHGGDLCEAVAVAAHGERFDHGGQFETGIGGQPMDVLADFQRYKKCGRMGIHE